MERGLYEEDLEMFRELTVEFNSREVAPHYQEWDHEHMMARTLWNAAGEQGHLHLAVPEESPSPTAACSCTAVRATTWNIPSPGITWPHACSRSSAIPVRSCAESSAGIAN